MQNCLLPTAYCLLFALAGCNPGPAELPEAEVAKLRTERLLAEEPADAQGVLAVRQAVAEKAEGAEVTLVGVVGGMPNPLADTEPEFPWRPRQASFFVVDEATAAEFAKHTAEAGENHQDCPFCARRAAEQGDSVAVVNFTGPDAKVLPVDARQLFDLKADETVVIRGKARLLGGEVLVVDAKEMFVKK